MLPALIVLVYLMFKPNLIVLAGCNGSGKSTWSQDFLPSSLASFDADKCKKQIYDSFSFDFELREEMSWNKTHDILKTDIFNSIKSNKNFAYETNFNYEPIYWVKQFKNVGYQTHLLFFSLKSVELAKERVLIRFQNGGHYVSDHEVASRYTDGFKNLNEH
jgi:predicted ABC-type ATPase